MEQNTYNQHGWPTGHFRSEAHIKSSSHHSLPVRAFGFLEYDGWSGTACGLDGLAKAHSWLLERPDITYVDSRVHQNRRVMRIGKYTNKSSTTDPRLRATRSEASIESFVDVSAAYSSSIFVEVIIVRTQNVN